MLYLLEVWLPVAQGESVWAVIERAQTLAGFRFLGGHCVEA